MIPLARSFQIPTRTTDLALGTGFYAVTGWAFRETTGTAGAVLEIIDGIDANGNLIAPITLLANESTRDLQGIVPLGVEMGIFVHVVSGSVKGALWAVPGSELGDIAIERGLGHVWSGTG